MTRPSGSPGPLLALLLAAAPPAAAGATPVPAGPASDPVTTVRVAERQVRLALLSNAPRPDFERIGATFVDHDEVARRSLGPRWASLKPADRAAFSNALRGLTEETWLSGLLRPDPLYAFAVFGTSATGGEAEVKTRVQSAGKQSPVDFRLVRGKDGRWRIFDWSVNGVSVVAGYREQFPRVLDEGGMPTLLASVAAQRRALVELRAPKRP